jgi:hypothetical protein
LAGILAVQVILSVHLLPYVGGDHDDEAIYIYGGHQLLYELLHGGGSPYYETWYSGAPVIYPTAAALADHFGGLMLARVMSLVFMMTATVLLFLTARRLFGYWVGITAAGLFIGLGLTQNIGVMATYDAMALMIVSAAAYCAVRSANSIPCLLLVPLLLLFANATKYVTVLFDPVVIGVAGLQLVQDRWRRVSQRIIAVGGTTVFLIIVMTWLAGSAYVSGILVTTLARQTGNNTIYSGHFTTPTVIVSQSWEWTGAVVALGVLALAVSLLRGAERGRHSIMLMFLVFAGLLVTLGNIRLHTDQSMNKHDDFGMWFACIPAAYALAYLADVARSWRTRTPVLIFAAAITAVSGYHYSQLSQLDSYFSLQTLTAYDNSTYKFIGPYLTRGNEEYLLASKLDSEMVYDNSSAVGWWQFFDDTYLKYPIPGRGGDSHGQTQGLACGNPGQPPLTDPHCMYIEGNDAYVTAIRAHWFAVVTLDGNRGLYTDQLILATVKSTPGYVLLSTQGGAPSYIYAPDYPGFQAQAASRHQAPLAVDNKDFGTALISPQAARSRSAAGVLAPVKSGQGAEKATANVERHTRKRHTP